jgi:hypothetical protein
LRGRAWRNFISSCWGSAGPHRRRPRQALASLLRSLPELRNCSATHDPARSRALLDEGEHWLADGCVSHNYLEFYRHAIEVSLRSGDWDRAERYADALEAYTRDERLPWADLVIGAGRLLARAGCAGPGAKARKDHDALLAEARRMQFNEIATLIAGGTRP